MSCFIPKGGFTLPSLPGLPSIKIPDPKLPNERARDSSHPASGLPSIFSNWHPNLCDLLILLYIIFLILQGNPFPNPTLKEANDWVASITEGTDYFGDSTDVDMQYIPPQLIISVKSLRAKVYPQDRDIIMKTIFNRYDSNNEFGDITTASDINVNEMEAIFELNNLDASDIPEYYELKKTQFTRNLIMKRV